jgi:hypothetical protein
MAAPSGLTWRIANLAIACACIGGCPDDRDQGDDREGEGGRGGTFASAGMGGSGATAGAGARAAGGPACAPPSGVYDATFEALDGTCGALPGHSLTLDAATILIQKLASFDVESEIIIEGCTLAITRITRTKQGIPVQRMVGQALTIEDDGTIAGVVRWTLYDELGQASCSGDYQATLTPDGQSLGGAVGSAGNGGGAGSDSADEPSFSDLHATEIQKDCSESVTCFLQRDEQLADDPFEACVADSSTALDGDERLQAAFLANYERCKAYVVCDYYDCATSG